MTIRNRVDYEEIMYLQCSPALARKKSGSVAAAFVAGSLNGSYYCHL
jgi:hypothetical protein